VALRVVWAEPWEVSEEVGEPGRIKEYVDIVQNELEYIN